MIANLVLITGILAIMATAFYYVRKSGKDAQKVSDLGDRLKDIGKVHEIENKNAVLPDGDAFRKLMQRWRR